MTYPKELPVFRVLGRMTCGCNDLHVEGSPSQYHPQSIDAGPLCHGGFDPLDLRELVPLTKAARDMWRLVRDQ